MITKRDLEEAIAECQGQRNPNASTCLKLAAFYTIRKELFGGESEAPAYSYAPAPMESYGTSDFLQSVANKPMPEVMQIVDELMETMKVLQPRIYNSVMRKLENL